MNQKFLASALLVACLAAFSQSAALAQTTSSGTGSSTVTSVTASTAESSNAGNQQNITFNSTTGTSSGPQTLNTHKSGTDTSVIEYSGSYKLKNTPSVNGGNLTTSNDTCMGSTSGSINAPGIGLGFGTTWTDENCKRLKMSRELWNKGFRAASLAVDCITPEAREALEMTGTKCPQSMTEEERRAAFGESVSSAAPAAQKQAR